ncbi:hypothetical protein BMT55_09760 [Listeria newyorkensis]|uniref:Preprotein translocase subunit SecB n=1 Tax=Listeria newyorkensis TaxID=1497681 RepID=A0ABX4XNN8_9LIST|nr:MULTISPECIES: hypothetical protein [Listeria]KGL38146.1 hypothetical protein EP56_16765 [Listeriaceae bacterium FSL A5-0209]KGL39302.1 hypothetical protein EP58_14160 [Listeria newyorkensis]PNP91981.1 hypothetical protein BMT55_09760 [Listeria newyorkensis]RQW66112.1 hypothetical protein DUK53_12260 [Listeria sp. SHR_NRA_18]WAO22249.1 hypothetical protein OTR81_02880 [Listeria newyorkensis]
MESLELDLTIEQIRLTKVETNISVDKGSLSRKNEIEFSLGKGENNILLVTDKESIYDADTDNTLLYLEVEATYLIDGEFSGIEELSGDSEVRTHLTEPVLEQASLIVGFLTEKIFLSPMIVPPVELAVMEARIEKYLEEQGIENNRN